MESQTVLQVHSPSSSTHSPPPTLMTTASSTSFPPSPPSSCGGHSPPPKSINEPRISLSSPPPPPPQPPSQNKLPPPQATLTFSIENILRPDFGCSNRRNSSFLPQPSPPEGLRTPPKTPELPKLPESPVDLSHKGPNNVPAAAPTPKAPAEDRTRAEVNSATTASTNTAGSGPRSRYPENPEELANPKVPQDEMIWPAWVYCTRYSDRPSSGPRSRRIKRRERNPEEKRPRTAFTSEQLSRLKVEFDGNKYLTEKRRQELARELGLNESQIKIWFQNKRAKIKKSSGPKNGLAQHLMAQGLYNHSTMPVDEDDPYLN